MYTLGLVARSLGLEASGKQLKLTRERVCTYATTRAHGLSAESEKGSMDEWTIYPSLNNRNRYALGSPVGREMRRGEAVEIVLGGFRIPGFIEYSPNGDYFTSMTNQSICGLCAGMKVHVVTFNIRGKESPVFRRGEELPPAELSISAFCLL